MHRWLIREELRQLNPDIGHPHGRTPARRHALLPKSYTPNHQITTAHPALHKFNSRLHPSPKVVCIELLTELRINVDNMHIPLLVVSNDSLIVLSSTGVSFNINAQRTIDLEP